MILRLLARIAGSSEKRIYTLATHREYDHMMQPIKQSEYVAAAVFAIINKRGNRDKP